MSVRDLERSAGSGEALPAVVGSAVVGPALALLLAIALAACGGSDSVVDAPPGEGAAGVATSSNASDPPAVFVPIEPEGGVPFEGSPPRRAIMIDKLEGKPAPELEIKTWLNARGLKLAALKGEVVMLDFWGSWCAPCRAWTKRLIALHEKYKDRGFHLIGIHTGRGADRGREYVHREKIPYPVGFDFPDGTTIKKKYGVDSYPDFYFIDYRGILRYADVSSSASVEQIEAIIEALLAERERDLGK